MTDLVHNADGLDVYGLGTAAIDIIQRVDKLPRADDFALILGETRTAGGSAANVIVQAARLGASCSFAVCVGDDKDGELFLNSLGHESIDTGGIISRQDCSTTRSIVTVANDGSKFISLNMGKAFFSFEPKELHISEIESARVFYTDLLPPKAAAKALRVAHDAGVHVVAGIEVSLDLMQAFGWKTEDLIEILPSIDTLIPCQTALKALTGLGNIGQAAQKMASMGPQEVIVTLGSQGSIAATNNSTLIRIPADQPSNNKSVRDTTGAGDSYAGAYIYARYLLGWSLRDSMRFASRCAAYTCCGEGARTSPRISDLEPAELGLPDKPEEHSRQSRSC